MKKKKFNTIILGSGIAGLAADHYLNDESIILEKENFCGGLCHSFSEKGFIFDTFIHLSFTNEKEVIELFSKSTNNVIHNPRAYNYYRGHWIKHPVQNNIFSLTTEEKVNIIEGFINRKESVCDNYEEWLRNQFGDYFAEKFPLVYTKKYWTVEAKELETKWIGKRLYQPPIREVIKGSFEEDLVNRYYAKEMRYPCKGGYQQYLNTIINEKNIKLNSRVIEIDPREKVVKTINGEEYRYNNLISTIPLPELCKIIKGIPTKIVEAANKLNYTSGFIVSLGFKKSDIPQHLWFYIYDEDILAARVYSPNLKSKDNVPEGCSSIQAEIFFANDEEVLASEIVLENTIKKLSQLYSFTRDEIFVSDIRFEKYANIIFDYNIYKNRKIVLDYLDSIGIKSIGRFGKWEYFWTHQAFLDGKEVTDSISNVCS